jgi:hypothetical protein
MQRLHIGFVNPGSPTAFVNHIHGLEVLNGIMDREDDEVGHRYVQQANFPYSCALGCGFSGG